MRQVLAAMLLVFAAAMAQAAAPILRAHVTGKSPHLVGQQVRVVVEVLVPNYFMSSVEIPSMTIDGAVVSMPDGGAENFSETIGGATYAGIRRSFTVVPMQEGDFKLPPAKVTFRYAASPGKPREVALSLPPKSFKAVLPAGAKVADGPALVAKVAIRQSLDRQLQDIRAGDTLTRTIEIRASNTQSMVIPPTHFVAPDGVRVYPRDPELTDMTGARGEFLGGMRVDRATYLFDEPGDYVLPEIDVAWFDAASGKRENAVAPAIRLSVAANTAGRPGIATEAEPKAPPTRAPLPWKRWLAWLALASSIAAIVVLLGRYLAPRLGRWRASRRHAHEQSESTYFARLEHACRSNDAAATYRSLLAWRARVPEVPLTGRLRGEIERLEASLFATDRARSAWGGAALAEALADARANRGNVGQMNVARALPALNP